MPDRYLLNSSVLFEADKNRLSSINTEQAPVILNQPASRCLELLIKNHPEVVKQRDLFDFVWGELGQNVPSNTLYQNISLLRKGLKAFGDGFDEAIVTLPRQGFRLNPELRITEPTKNDLIGTQLPETYTEEKYTTPPIETVEAFVNKENDTFIADKKTLSLRFILPSILLCILIGGFIGFIFEKNTSESPPFDVNYLTQTLKLDDCTLYESKEATLPITKDDLVHWGIQCHSSPYLYLMQYKYSALANILNCKFPLSRTNTADCVNYFVIRQAKP